MTSPIEGKTSADDSAPSGDDVPLTLGEKKAPEGDKTPPSAPFVLLGSADAEACGSDGCCSV